MIELFLLPPIVAGAFGFASGYLLTRSTALGSIIGVVFFGSYGWALFAMISIQAWGAGDFEFYQDQLRVIFLPSPLIAGTVGCVIVAAWRRTGRDGEWLRWILTGTGGLFVFGGGALLCIRIAAGILAADTTGGRGDALDRAIALSVCGPLAIGMCLVLAAWGFERWRATLVRP